MRTLPPGEAVKRLNGDKSRNIDIHLPSEQWTMVDQRARALGFSGLKDYVESLLEMDTYGKAFEAVVQRRLDAAHSGKASTSRIADETGLSPRLVGVLRSSLED